MAGKTEQLFIEVQDKLAEATGGAIINIEISEAAWRSLMIQNKELLFGITKKEDMPNAYAIGGMIIHREKKR